MDKATRFTNLEVTGDVKVGGDLKLNATASAYTAASADATAAADSAPTKAEFDAVVTLVNELKAKHNALVSKLT